MRRIVRSVCASEGSPESLRVSAQRLGERVVTNRPLGPVDAVLIVCARDAPSPLHPRLLDRRLRVAGHAQHHAGCSSGVGGCGRELRAHARTLLVQARAGVRLELTTCRVEPVVEGTPLLTMTATVVTRGRRFVGPLTVRDSERAGLDGLLRASAAVLAASTESATLASCDAAEVSLRFAPAANRCLRVHALHEELGRLAPPSPELASVRVDASRYPVRLARWSDEERAALQDTVARLGWTVEVDEGGLWSSAQGHPSALEDLVRRFGAHLGLSGTARVQALSDGWLVTDGRSRVRFESDDDEIVLRERAFPLVCPTEDDPSWSRRYDGVLLEGDAILRDAACEPGAADCQPETVQPLRLILAPKHLQFEREVVVLSRPDGVELRCAVSLLLDLDIPNFDRVRRPIFTPYVPGFFDARTNEPIDHTLVVSR